MFKDDFIWLYLVDDSFFVCVDPARVGRMSRETYLPTGMEGVIFCPVQADPPVLYVNWTKDGNNLNLDNVSCCRVFSTVFHKVPGFDL